MKSITLIRKLTFFILLFSAIVVIFTASSISDGNEGITSIFLDFKKNCPLPNNMIPFSVTWNAVGMDADEIIYVVYGDQKQSVAKDKNTTGFPYSDCALCTYNTKTGEYKTISSMVDVLKAENNWKENEFVEKGHTHLPIMNGKMYIGTMEFHSIEGKRQYVIDEMKKYRGAHLLTYDIKKQTFKDATKNVPGGVLFPNQGVMALDDLPEYGYMVCMSTPKGDIALYNIKTEKIDRIIPGIDEELGNVISREVIATPNGKIYFGYDNLDKDEGHLYVLDINTFVTKRLPNISGSVINGMAKSSDRKFFYFINQRCDIYQINTKTDEIKKIGNLVPESERNQFKASGLVPTSLGIVISPDNKKIFGMPMINNEVPLDTKYGKIHANGKKYAGVKAMGVYEFDIVSASTSKIYDFEKDPKIEKSPSNTFNGYLTGSAIIDSKGRIYMARNEKPGLVQVDLSYRFSDK